MEKPPEIEEITLVQRVLDKEPEAFRWIVQAYEGPLLAYLYGLLGDWENARDVAQETFIAAYFALPRWIPPHTRPSKREQNTIGSTSLESNVAHIHPLAPWLYRIATNQAFAFLKRLSAQKRSSSKDNTYDSSQNTHSLVRSGKKMTMEDQSVERELLQEALGQLAEEDATCIVLRFICNEKYAEIAERLGLTAEAVRKRISRGLIALRSIYKRLDMEDL